MEVILSTTLGVKVETQTVENDPITELAKKAMAPHPLIGLVCKVLFLPLRFVNSVINHHDVTPAILEK